jgi:hypothetical protein
MKRENRHEARYALRVRVKEFGIPPIHDGLVMGKRSPIGCAAMRKCLDLLVAAPFEHVEIDDDVIGDLLVRKTILLRIPRDTLAGFVVKNLKPLMSAEEVLHLDLEAEVFLTEEVL